MYARARTHRLRSDCDVATASKSLLVKPCQRSKRLSLCTCIVGLAIGSRILIAGTGTTSHEPKAWQGRPQSKRQQHASKLRCSQRRQYMARVRLERQAA